MDISPDPLSTITARIEPLVIEWQSRALEEFYHIVWPNAMHYKVKDGGKTGSRAVCNMLGINKERRQDLIRVYV